MRRRVCRSIAVAGAVAFLVHSSFALGDGGGAAAARVHELLSRTRAALVTRLVREGRVALAAARPHDARELARLAGFFAPAGEHERLLADSTQAIDRRGEAQAAERRDAADMEGGSPAPGRGGR